MGGEGGGVEHAVGREGREEGEEGEAGRAGMGGVWDVGWKGREGEEGYAKGKIPLAFNFRMGVAMELILLLLLGMYGCAF
jgi:hypothetical protein